MNSQLIPFSFESASVRVVTHDDGSWSVVAKDVAEALRYQWNPYLINHVPEEWKGTNRIVTPGGAQEMLTLTEQGLYFFLGRSDKPLALPFQKWVYGEVLPEIRKTGRYEAKPVAPHADTRVALDLFSTSAKAAKLAGFKGNMIALSAGNFTRSVTGIDVLALMGATHLLADPRGMTYTPTELGKLCDPPLGPVKVNLLLEAAGLQSREFDRWRPTEAANGLFEWLDTGKRHSDGAPVKQVKWFRDVLNKVA